MLQLRPTCENCNKDLPPHSDEAMICSYECTFCKSCVQDVLENVCPNCGGGFEKRPVRPKAGLGKYPASQSPVYNAVDLSKFQPLKEKNKNIDPHQR